MRGYRDRHRRRRCKGRTDVMEMPHFCIKTSSSRDGSPSESSGGRGEGQPSTASFTSRVCPPGASGAHDSGIQNINAASLGQQTAGTQQRTSSLLSRTCARLGYSTQVLCGDTAKTIPSIILLSGLTFAKAISVQMTCLRFITVRISVSQF
ncbi:hypothetical protein OE88DRAFT_332465 [Heliocybe sulcata]|uniref:Uncharacterized protein n=1 Tax=Heliocybe sulcata TaxID=5364 RepID=A0A5C3MZ34_9AGAM|nr:hypothetical protein OE88DRAFT_332465 [Heliocybe sulcata]